MMAPWLIRFSYTALSMSKQQVSTKHLTIIVVLIVNLVAQVSAWFLEVHCPVDVVQITD
jgi:hypothetical protein